MVLSCISNSFPPRQECFLKEGGVVREMSKVSGFSKTSLSRLEENNGDVLDGSLETGYAARGLSQS